MDIIVTIPKKTKLEIINKEFDLTKDGSHYKNIKIPRFPKACRRSDYVHMIHNGRYLGKILVMDFQELDFTGASLSGKFVRTSYGLIKDIEYNVLKNKTDLVGFRGYQYFTNWFEGLEN